MCLKNFTIKGTLAKILDECRALWGELKPERSAILNLQVTRSATYV